MTVQRFPDGLALEVLPGGLADVPPELADYAEDLSRMPSGYFLDEQAEQLNQEVWVATQKAAADADYTGGLAAYGEMVAARGRVIARERQRRDEMLAAGLDPNFHEPIARNGQPGMAGRLDDGKQKRVGWK